MLWEYSSILFFRYILKDFSRDIYSIPSPHKIFCSHNNVVDWMFHLSQINMLKTSSQKTVVFFHFPVDDIGLVKKFVQVFT